VVAPGAVVILNGTSSAGKTTLALAFQELRVGRDECWLVFGLDDFIAKMPGRWIETDTWKGPLSEDGLRLERDGDTARFHIGEQGRRLLAGYRRAIGEIARSGLNVIVDDVTIEVHEWQEWCNALDGLDPVWVAVRCEVDVAVQRETDRGDRARGLVRGQADLVHRFPVYDLELDTTSDPVAVVARRLDAYLEGSETPTG